MGSGVSKTSLPLALAFRRVAETEAEGSAQGRLPLLGKGHALPKSHLGKTLMPEASQTEVEFFHRHEPCFSRPACTFSGLLDATVPPLHVTLCSEVLYIHSRDFSPLTFTALGKNVSFTFQRRTLMAGQIKCFPRAAG